jgi:pimeloyl-ACP methyl ester carboxylesterase
LWPEVVSEAVDAVLDPVVIGHSTGGEYLLSVPGLEERIAGLVLISSAPDARWLPVFETMAASSPSPELDEVVQRFEADPTPKRLHDVVMHSAGWNFEPAGLVAGRKLLDGLPYNPAAVAWSTAHFDRSYVAAW